MESLRFEWDAAKSTSNVRKHGVGFSEARTVFEDDDALLIPDDEHSVGERRYVLLGFSAARRLLVVVHCEPEQDLIRLISARLAERSERAQYLLRRLP